MLKLTLMQAGYCTSPEFMMLRGGKWGRVPIPALFALIEHPDFGPVLFDTGYSPRFFSQTQQWPYSLYKKITPVYLDDAETAARRLQAKGINPASVNYLIISHFHADHIGGLADFPNANFIYFSDAYAAVCHKCGFAALGAGFLSGLIPPHFETRSMPVSASRLAPLPDHFAPFNRGVDLFDDGTLLAVPLPGHARWQMGLFLQEETWGPMFLAADACWHSSAFRELRFPNPLVNLLLSDPKAYRDTLTRLHQLYRRRPDMHIIPSHCPVALAQYSNAN